MYKTFYNLTVKPFQISTDPRFLWLGEKHREALATLKYGVQDNKGFLLITGDVGTGKTTLINALVSSFGNKVIYAAIPDPGLENLDFLKYIAHVFKLEKKFESKGDFLILFSRFLMRAYRSRKAVVLIIDEAQLLSQEMLEQIRLLSNIERQQRKLINIFFIGQSEFNDTLLKYENRALRQRITINYNLDPLSLRETGEYIEHRLKKAGSTERIFNPGAIKKIYLFSKGYPRLINVVCDHAMLTGYVKEARTIDAGIIKECVKELNILPGARSGQGKKVKRSRPGPSRYPVPAKQSGLGRSLTYMLLVALLVLVAALVLKIDSRTAGLTTNLKKIESLFIFREKPGGAAPEINGQTKPINVEKLAAIEKARAQILASAADRDEQPGPASSGPDEQAAQKKPEVAATAGRVAEEGDGLPPDASKALPEDAQGEDAGTKDPGELIADIPLENPPMDPIVKAREFIARTGGKLIIHFSYNSNEISKPEFDRLSQFADIAAQTPEIMIYITGHTDTSGSARYNRKLSIFRANIVKSYFVGRGVRPESIISAGKGPDAPMVRSAPGIPSISNRRVEIEMKLE